MNKNSLENLVKTYDRGTVRKLEQNNELKKYSIPSRIKKAVALTGVVAYSVIETHKEVKQICI